MKFTLPFLIVSLLGFLLSGSNTILDKQTGNDNNVEDEDVQITAVELGEKLFFDPILSLDKTIACASCHKPEFAFADNVPFSLGVGDSLTKRNTPSVMNMVFRPYFFFDGRVANLEDQAMIPIEDPREMHLRFDSALYRVRQSEVYDSLFRIVYEEAPDSLGILSVIAEYVRSLESDGSAPHDRWMNGEETAMTASQIRGRDLFLNKGKCFDCHFSPDFTGDEFKNIGLYDGVKFTDRGRFEISEDSTDLGKFKVPGLRNVALTAPYMHNGKFETLEEVVDYYDKPSLFVSNPINRDTILNKPMGLTATEKEDLVNFLHSLTDEVIPNN